MTNFIIAFLVISGLSMALLFVTFRNPQLPQAERTRRIIMIGVGEAILLAAAVWFLLLPNQPTG